MFISKGTKASRLKGAKVVSAVKDVEAIEAVKVEGLYLKCETNHEPWATNNQMNTKRERKNILCHSWRCKFPESEWKR